MKKNLLKNINFRKLTKEYEHWKTNLRIKAFAKYSDFGRNGIENKYDYKYLFTFQLRRVSEIHILKFIIWHRASVIK